MPVTYTNRRGVTYYLCRGRTKTGGERYHFAREVKGEAVEEMPPGYVIRESVNGVVSLARDRPSLVAPDEEATIEAALARHPERRKYRIQLRHDRIEVYEDTAPDVRSLMDDLGFAARHRPDLAEQLRSRLEGRHYAPVMRFILDDPAERRYHAERMCYRSSVDGWLRLHLFGSLAELAGELIPTLGTERFFDLW